MPSKRRRNSSTTSPPDVKSAITPPSTDPSDLSPGTLNDLPPSSHTDIPIDPALLDDHVIVDLDYIARLLVASIETASSSDPSSSSTPTNRTTTTSLTTFPSSSSSITAVDQQLVNDTNRVGPGHDIMVRPFVCAFEYCNKAFARKSDLARHFRIHTNERPFVCLHRGCGKSFIQRSALTVHIRTHTGERPHVCEACEKTFADSSSLARHRRIHTGKRPYVCKAPGCTRSFARKVTYGKHYRSSHPDQPPLSSDLAKPTVPMPFYAIQRPSSILRQPGPPDAEGKPQYWIPTPADTDDSTPHAYAASFPPESPAYHTGGKSGGRRGVGAGRAGVGRHGAGTGAAAGKKGSATGRAKKRAQQHRPPSISTADTAHSPFSEEGGLAPAHADAEGDVGRGNGNGEERKTFVSPDQTEPTTSVGTPVSSHSSHLFEIHSAFGDCRTPDSASFGDKHQYPSASDPTWTGGSSVSTIGTATTPSSLGGHGHGHGHVGHHSGQLVAIPLASIPEGGTSPLDLGPPEHAYPLGRPGLEHSHSSSDSATPVPTYVPNAFTGYLSSRATSMPGQLRTASNPDSYAGGVGGGFSSSQVSMPPGMLQPVDTRGDRAVSAPMSRQPTRTITPDLHGIPSSTVPSFTFQEAELSDNEPLMPLYTSAVNFDPSPTQYLTTPTTMRHHPSMPTLTRHKSAPDVPTMSTSTWDISPVSATSSVFSHQHQPTPQLSPVGAEWINTDATAGVMQQQQAQQATSLVPSPVIFTPATSSGSQMSSLFTTEPLPDRGVPSAPASASASSPIWPSQPYAQPQPQPSLAQYQQTAYPNPPHPHILQRNPFSTSISPNPNFTSTCPPAPLSHLQPQPQPTFVPYQPAHFTPVSAVPPTMPTLGPMWQTYRNVSQPVSALGSPVVLSTASSHVAGFGPNFLPLPRAVSDVSTSSSEHNVLLGTPQHTAAVERVGLGISNVHFENRYVAPADLTMRHNPPDTASATAGTEMQVYAEVEPEVEMEMNDLDEYIVHHSDDESEEDDGAQDDGSDDEFIPGRKPKSASTTAAAKKKSGSGGGGVKGHRKRGSIKATRKVK